MDAALTKAFHSLGFDTIDDMKMLRWDAALSDDPDAKSVKATFFEEPGCWFDVFYNEAAATAMGTSLCLRADLATEARDPGTYNNVKKVSSSSSSNFNTYLKLVA